MIGPGRVWCTAVTVMWLSSVVIADEDASKAVVEAVVEGAQRLPGERTQEDPALLDWIEKRTGKLKDAVVSSQEAHNLIESVHSIGTEEIGPVEQFVESEIEGYVSSKYLAVVAWIVSLTLLSFPLLTTVYGLMQISQRLSVRQFILLGNLFNFALALLFCVAGLCLRRDPLSALQSISSSNFVVVQLLVTIVFVLFCVLLRSAIASAETTREKDIFRAQICIYAALALQYERAVWHPALLGEGVEPHWIWYPIYLSVFMAMTFLTAVVGAINGRGQDFKYDIESLKQK